MTVKTDNYIIGLGANPVFITKDSGATAGALELRSGDPAGTNSLLQRLDTPLLDAIQSTLTGTFRDFTVPAWAKRVKIGFFGVGSNAAATSPLIVRVVTSAGVLATGYTTTLAAFNNGSAVATGGAITSEFRMTGATDSSHRYSGSLTLDYFGSNIWEGDGKIGVTSNGNALQTVGHIALAAPLLGLRVTFANGTDAFTAGSLGATFE